ncbi:hypothetical protein ABIC80_004389 [Kosakonia sp. 1610]
MPNLLTIFFPFNIKILLNISHIMKYNSVPGYTAKGICALRPVSRVVRCNSTGFIFLSYGSNSENLMQCNHTNLHYSKHGQSDWIIKKPLQQSTH